LRKEKLFRLPCGDDREISSRKIKSRNMKPQIIVSLQLVKTFIQHWSFLKGENLEFETLGTRYSTGCAV